MNKRFYKFTAIILVLAVLTGVFAALSSCGGEEKPIEQGKDYSDYTPKTYTPTLVNKSDSIVLGVTDVQSWKFVKKDGKWFFDGIYAVMDGTDKKVFTGSSGKVNSSGSLIEDGAFFTVLTTSDSQGVDKQIDPAITSIEVVKNNAAEKQIKISGKGYFATLTANSASQFIERIFTFTFASACDVEIGDMSFVLRTKVDEFSEYGYVLSHTADEPQHPLPYSFPGIASRLTAEGNESEIFSFVNVVDWYETDDQFKTARRRKTLNDFFEEGILSSEGFFSAGESYQMVERINVRDGRTDNFYDLIYDARSEYSVINEISLEELILANGNMSVYDWDEAAYQLTYEIEDARGRPLGDDMGTWGPYGYNNGGAQSFGAMNVLKGLVRYAIATNDQDLYDFALKYTLQFVRPDSVYGRCYVMPLSSISAYSAYTSDYFFFNSCFSNGDYTATDSWFADAMQFGSFKYYNRVAVLGEIALLTNNAELKTAYLRLMPFIKRIRGENFEQAVEWGLDEKPKLDYDNGGSGGAAAMWANCMYIASQIETDVTAKTEYMALVKGGIDRSNTQGFERSSALREYPKPECIGYAVRMNLFMFEYTGEKSYLNEALKIYRGQFFYIFTNTHPSTYFQTVGYSYACARERWEAFMEMVESLTLLLPIMEYTDDPLLYEIYITMRESALSTLPVNGYPEGVLGGHSDWLDALFIPFEQPTATQGDNPAYDGGGSSWNRHSKELYGSGEIYTGALMYSVLGRANDKNVLVLNYTAIGATLSRTNNEYKIYKVGSADTSTAVHFNNYAAGNYQLSLDGTVKGIYTAEQLSNGITLTLKSKTPVKAVISPASSSGQAADINQSVTVSTSEVRSNSTVVTVLAQNAAHYKLYVSTTEAFEKYTTQISYSDSNTFTLGFEDSQTLYIKAAAYDANGNGYIESAAIELVTNDVEIGLLEDFGYSLPLSGQNIGNWVGTAEISKEAIQLTTDVNVFIDYPTDTEKFRTPTGYMAIYKPQYTGYDKDTFENTFSVNLSDYPLFDFYPYTKNYMSKFSLLVTIGGNTYTLMDKVSSFDLLNYRYDLAQISGKSGVQNIKVTMVSEGFNRGFAVSQMRFVTETAYKNYELTNLNFTSEAAVEKDGSLVITNPSTVGTQSEFALVKFDSALYDSMSISFTGMTASQNGFVRATVEIKNPDGSAAFTKEISSVTENVPLQLTLSEMGLSKDTAYSLKVQFKRNTTVLSNISVRTVRLMSSRVNSGFSGFNSTLGLIPTVVKVNGNYQLTNNWKTNWAFANTADGTVYNDNPNVGYASIYKENIYVDLDENPVIKFTVSEIKGGVTWSLKCNDGSLSNDLTLKETSAAGTFTVNLRDAFNRGGTVKIRLDFYVIHDRTADKSKGVKFDGFSFLYSTSLYENNFETSPTVTFSEAFTLNTANTDYITVDIPELTYGNKWLIYLVDSEGNSYELKTVYERAYGKMYYRGKEGAFKYQLSDIFPEFLLNTDKTFRLKILLDGQDTVIKFASIRLSNNNETVVPQCICNIR